MATERVLYRKNHVYPPAVLLGAGTGLVLLLLGIASRALYEPPGDRAWPVLLYALVTYFPTGFVTARRVVRVRRSSRERLRLAPPAAHALLAGGLLVVAHALVLGLTNTGIPFGLPWLATEGILAALIAGTGGLFASRNGETAADGGSETSN